MSGKLLKIVTGNSVKVWLADYFILISYYVNNSLSMGLKFVVFGCEVYQIMTLKARF